MGDISFVHVYAAKTTDSIPVVLTLGRTRKVIPPPWNKGGGGLMDPLPRFFANEATELRSEIASATEL